MPPLLRCPGSRRCPVSFLQYYRCHWEVWVGDQPWSHLPCWALARCPARPSRSSRPKQGWALSKGVCRAAQPPRSISRTPAGPQSSCWSPRAYPLFQALSCWGHWGSLCYKLTLQQTVLDFIPWSQFPLCCCFSCRTVETSLHPQSSCGFWGCLRATLGIAFREGLGIGGVKRLPKSELRKGTQSTCSGGVGCMDIPIAA